MGCRGCLSHSGVFMKNNWFWITVVSFIGVTVPRVSATYLYDVPFEDPPQTNGMPVTVGSGPDRPASMTYAYITNGAGDFTSQAAVVTLTGHLAFAPGDIFTGGLHRFSWDYSMLTFGGSMFQSGVSLQAAVGHNVGFYLHYYSTAPGTLHTNVILTMEGIEVAPFTLGVHDQFDLLVDLDNDYYNLSLNGSPLMTNVTFASDADVYSFIFDTPPSADPTYAVDNFQWEIIPEPGVLALLALGCSLFGTIRLRRRIRIFLAKSRTE